MTLHKTHAAALALAGLLAVTAATPSVARDRTWAAAGAGFAAGAIVGAAAANSNRGYYYGPYAYEPAPSYTYVEPAPVYVPAETYAYEPVYPAPMTRWNSPTYNPEQPMDPDPRIGGSVRNSTND